MPRPHRLSALLILLVLLAFQTPADAASTITHTDWVVTQGGTVNGGPGDVYRVLNSFLNSSTMNTTWETSESTLRFVTGTGANPFSHDVALPSEDVGPNESGYMDNFAWGTMEIASGNALVLMDGNTGNTGTALYLRIITGANLSGPSVTNITGNGVNIYYDPAQPENAYLNSGTYSFTNGGSLIPIQEPVAVPAMSHLAVGILFLVLATLGRAYLAGRNNRT
jgi:hypothetical protein